MENSKAKSRITGENKAQSASSGKNTPADQSSNKWPKKLASIKLSRLQALQLFGGAIVSTALGGLLPSCNTTSNPIVIENQQAGSSDWQMNRKNYWVSDDIKGQIKGYASATSVNKGEQIDFHVTVNPAQKFTIDVYRMGWYNGQGGRLLQNIGPLDGITQPKPTSDPTTGLIDCNWPSSYTLTVPDTWTSGIYLAVLTNEKNFQNYIIFVVRDDASKAALLYQLSVTTYQAYNLYPDDKTTGKSLYSSSYGAPIEATGAQAAVKVSFNRPYSGGAGSGNFVNAYPTGDWDRHFVNWIEKSGYDVTYSTNLDTHQNGAALKNHRGFLSVGHDEYWSQQMYEAVESARDSGVHLAFFGSDTCYWQVRFEPDANNVPDRTMVCYKDGNKDPVQDSTTTHRWRTQPDRSEQGLVGVQYTTIVKEEDRLNTPYIVKNSSNWVYNGTGFADGDEVAGLVGYEADRYFSEYSQPQGTEYTLLSQSPLVRNDSDIADYSNSSIYKAPSGAWVFASGTNQWSWGLDMSGVVDSRIQQTTTNILNTFTGAFAPPSG